MRNLLSGGSLSHRISNINRLKSHIMWNDSRQEMLIRSWLPQLLLTHLTLLVYGNIQCVRCMHAPDGSAL